MVHAQMHHPVFHSHNLTKSISGHTSILHRLGEMDADGDEDAVYLSPLALGLAALLLIINGLLSAYLSLGLHKTLGIAAVRQVAPHMHMQLCTSLSRRVNEASIWVQDALYCLLLLLLLCIVLSICMILPLQTWFAYFLEQIEQNCSQVWVEFMSNLALSAFQVYHTAHYPGIHLGPHIFV